MSRDYDEERRRLAAQRLAGEITEAQWKASVTEIGVAESDAMRADLGDFKGNHTDV